MVPLEAKDVIHYFPREHQQFTKATSSGISISSTVFGGNFYLKKKRKEKEKENAVQNFRMFVTSGYLRP